MVKLTQGTEKELNLEAVYCLGMEKSTGMFEEGCKRYGVESREGISPPRPGGIGRGPLFYSGMTNSFKAATYVW